MTLLQDCCQSYVGQRGLLLTPSVHSSLEQISQQHASDSSGLVSDIWMNENNESVDVYVCTCRYTCICMRPTCIRFGNALLHNVQCMLRAIQPFSLKWAVHLYCLHLPSLTLTYMYMHVYNIHMYTSILFLICVSRFVLDVTSCVVCVRMSTSSTSTSSVLKVLSSSKWMLHILYTYMVRSVESTKFK